MKPVLVLASLLPLVVGSCTDGPSPLPPDQQESVRPLPPPPSRETEAFDAGSPAPRSDGACHCEKAEPGAVCTFSLQGFENGSFVHRDVQTFAGSVVHEIRTIEAGSRLGAFRDMSISGQADGLHNDGVPSYATLRQLEPECAEDHQEILLDDYALARARGCVVRKAIEREIGSAFAVTSGTWQENPKDLPDGSNSGPSFRRVDLTIRLRLTGECRE